MALESFNAYHSYLKAIEPLNDAERGRLFTACLQYSMTGEAQKLSGNERFIFPIMAAQIDRDKEKYDAKCKKQSERAKKRWDTTECHGMPRDATVYGGMPDDANDAKDKDKDYITPLPPQGELFGRFWAAYPKKVGKANCERWFARHKVDEEALQAMLDSLAYLKTTEQWQKDGGQYIPNPQTWLNGRRWEDESAKPPQREKVTYIGKL